MSLRGDLNPGVLALAAAAWLGCAVPAVAQGPTPAAVAAPTSSGQFEEYLKERALWNVLAAHLRERLKNGDAAERMVAAETLGEIYVRQIADASTPAERQRIDRQARELLSQVPEADSFRLRIELAVAAYRDAEDLAEKYRRRSVEESERVEAERILRAVLPQLEELVGKLNRQAEQLKRREAMGRDEDVAELKRELDRSRNLRSLANYYTGWANYYLAYLAGSPANATRAMEQFGVLLNAVPGRAASVERASGGRFALEHVARAALGCAMCAALLDDHIEAKRWIEAVDLSPDLSPAVRDQLFSRRLIVLASAGNWSEIEVIVRRHRSREENHSGILTLAEARLAAVLALETSSNAATPPRTKTLAGEIAQLSMGDLVALGEAGHVLSLVERYGTSGLVGEGFISSYVRGLHAYDAAREAKVATGEPAEQPTERPEVANQFREAAKLLKSAIDTKDASKFVGEAGTARITRGLALYFAGDLDAAAVELQMAATMSGADAQREKALWYAIVVLDTAVKGGKVSAASARDALASLYIQSFPASERSVKLLLDSLDTDVVSRDKAVEILLAVPRESPLHGLSRRQAAGILYTMFHGSRGKDQDFAAMKFIPVGEDALKFDQDNAIGGSGVAGRESAQRAIIQARRLAEAMLTMSTPDPDRAEAALTALENVAAMYSIDLSQNEPELVFRKLQIAVARRSFVESDRLIDRLHGLGGVQSQRADRWLYQRAIENRRRDPADVRARNEIIRFGSAVLTQMKESDQSAVGVREAVAAASIEAWRENADVSMRDAAIKLDTTQLTFVRTGSSLRRLAELVETVDRREEALGYWNELVAGLPPGTDAWHEARYHSIRLMARSDPAGAAAAYAQYRVLYPETVPEPWRTRFRELERTFVAAPTTPNGGAPAPTKGNAPTPSPGGPK